MRLAEGSHPGIRLSRVDQNPGEGVTNFVHDFGSVLGCNGVQNCARRIRFCPNAPPTMVTIPPGSSSSQLVVAARILNSIPSGTSVVCSHSAHFPDPFPPSHTRTQYSPHGTI